MESKDVYEIITGKVIEQLEKGVIPWAKPWISVEGSDAVSGVTGKSYSLINQILLNGPGEYLTFQQVNKLEGRVKAGEKASPVVFWKMIPSKEKGIDADGNEVTKLIPLLRYYYVFNINQCAGITAKFYKETRAEIKEIESCELADNLIDNYISREHINFSNDLSANAFYNCATDSIVVPGKTQYKSSAEYYSTTFHECIHSTGHKSRLDRFESVGAVFGDKSYSKEELVAEMGACALTSECGIADNGSVDNSVAYLANWVSKLREDKRLLVSAASKAERAVKYFKKGKEEEKENVK